VLPVEVEEVAVNAARGKRKARPRLTAQPVVNKPRVAIHALLASFEVTIAAQIAITLPAGYRSGLAKIISAASRLRRAISSATVAIDGFSLAAPGPNRLFFICTLQGRLSFVRANASALARLVERTA
jgi:hypothetical protein